MKHQSKVASKQLDPSAGESIRAERASPLRGPQEAGRLYLACRPTAGKSALLAYAIDHITRVSRLDEAA